MSFNFNLYRGPADLAPFTEWEENLAVPIGPRDEICGALSELLPSIQWESCRDARNAYGHGIDARYDDRFLVSMLELEPGMVLIITIDNRASPATLSMIMDRFSLNYCCSDFGDLRYPHRCDDNWKLVK